MSAFFHSHRVTYADCTLGDHIYYGRYLALLEAARGEFFRHLGTTFLQWQERDTLFPVVECRLRYLAPARYDDLLVMEVRVMLAKGARLNFAYTARNQSGAPVLEAETFHACTDVAGKSKRLPVELITSAQPHLKKLGCIPSH